MALLKSVVLLKKKSQNLRQTCSFILVYDNRIVKLKIMRYERINNVQTLL